MKLPSVYPLTIPSSQRMIRMTAIVSSMVGCLLRSPSSNGCATTLEPRRAKATRLFLAVIQMVAAIGVTAGLARAQDAPTPPVTQNGPSTAASAGVFLLGAGTAFAAHEAGHLLFDAIFDASPR